MKNFTNKRIVKVNINFISRSLTLLFVKVGFVTLMYTGCVQEDKPIKCISAYLIDNVSQEKLSTFIELEGINVWQEWDGLTTHIAENHFMADECDLYKYMIENNANLDSLSGQILFVYYVHSYLKNGYIDKASIKNQVDEILSK